MIIFVRQLKNETMKRLTREMIDEMDVNDFYEIYDDCFKDHYLSRPNYAKIKLSLGIDKDQINDFICDELGYDFITEKVYDYFTQQDENGVYKFETYFDDDATEIKSWLRATIEGVDGNDADAEYYDEYVYEMCSGWGWAEMLSRFIDYFDLENEWLENNIIPLCVKSFDDEYTICSDDDISRCYCETDHNNGIINFCVWLFYVDRFERKHNKIVYEERLEAADVKNLLREMKLQRLLEPEKIIN